MVRADSTGSLRFWIAPPIHRLLNEKVVPYPPKKVLADAGGRAGDNETPCRQRPLAGASSEDGIVTTMAMRVFHYGFQP